MGAQQPASRWTPRDRLILGLTLGLYLLPMARELLQLGWTRVFSNLAPDAFYYLQVARTHAQTGIFSFDQSLPTNGFHPAWQLLLAELYRVYEALGAPEQARLTGVLALQAACISGAIALLGATLRRARGGLPTTFLILPLGIYTLLVATISPGRGSLWASTDGMESGLVLLCWAAVLWLLQRPRILELNAGALAVGLAAGALGLARLDHFLAVPALLWVLGRAGSPRRWLLGCAAVAGTLLLGALVFNQWLAGSLLPVSGAAKSSFPWPTQALPTLALSLQQLGDLRTWHRLDRAALLLLPAVAAGGFLLRRPARSGPYQHALRASCLLVLLLAAYDLAFVPLSAQGPWYFPVSTLLITLLAIQLLDAWRCTRRLQDSPWLALPLLLLLPFFHHRVHQSDPQGQHYARFLTAEAPRLLAHYGAETPRLLELDDGIIAYATGLPTMSGTGLVLDEEAAQAREAGRLLELAHQRGHNRLVSSVYLNCPDPGLREGLPRAIAACVQRSGFFTAEEVDRFLWSVDYRGADLRFAVYGFEPRGPAPPP